MQPLISLFERYPVARETLPAALASAYAGGFFMPEGHSSERPYIFANFVESLDGIVAFNAPGQLGGGLISGENEQDKMVMGMLRACADAILFGGGSLTADANHVRTAAFIYPPLAQAYTEYRLQLGKQRLHPLSVVMTASGNINLDDRLFHTPDLEVLIVTTARGYERLATRVLSPRTTLQVIEEHEDEYTSGVSPQGVLRLLAREYHIKSVLYEGGPHLFSSLLAVQLVDELFLTFSPQLVGRVPGGPRLSLLEGYAFSPRQAPWAELISVKQADNHLLLRYRLQ